MCRISKRTVAVEEASRATVDDLALILWYEQGHRKPWATVAESTKERYRKLAIQEWSEIIIDEGLMYAVKGKNP